MSSFSKYTNLGLNKLHSQVSPIPEKDSHPTNKYRFAVYVIIIIGCFVSNSFGQISPGKLAQPHVSLEGISNCTKCHELGSGLSSEKCLECHVEINVQFQEKRGYHFQVVNQDKVLCTKCHADHAGRQFELIHWPDGEKNFDHDLSGFQLAGKHKSLECRKCHNEKLLHEDLEGFQEHIDPKKTYLGLHQACISCHIDEHRNQLGTGCNTCHFQDEWKPKTNFDHNKARFHLTGKHQVITCSKCHPGIVEVKTTANKNVSYVKYVDIAFQDCSSCHKDIHKSKFDLSCQKCHMTVGWREVEPLKFDHSKTRYPLLDKHAQVDCNKCHKTANKTEPLQFAQCVNCHIDKHKGESGSNCQKCHTTKGWKSFSKDRFDHSKTNFPLVGKHENLNCEKCHKTGNMVLPLQFKQCSFCHVDTHRGQFAERTDKGRCTSCHNEQGFIPALFSVQEHAITDFPLSGAHLATACINCHKIDRDIELNTYRIFKFSNFDCETCHQDPHFGQFTKIPPRKNCMVCHYTTEWSKLKFDHSRDSRYVLDGAHINVKCKDCHKSINANSSVFIRYRPIDVSCKTCHDKVK